MAVIDYTEMFKTPDEMADHFMLDHDEQLQAEANYLTAKGQGEMVCDLALKKKQDE